MDGLISLLTRKVFNISIERANGVALYEYQFAFKREAYDDTQPQIENLDSFASKVKNQPKTIGGCIRIGRGKNYVRHPLNFVSVSDSKGFIICDYRGEINKDEWQPLNTPYTLIWQKMNPYDYIVYGSIRDMQAIFTLGGMDDNFGLLSAAWGKIFNGKAILHLSDSHDAKLEIFILGGWLKLESISNGRFTKEINDSETAWMQASQQV